MRAEANNEPSDDFADRLYYCFSDVCNFLFVMGCLNGALVRKETYTEPDRRPK